jgi:uncharacterized protein YraI
MAESIWKTTNNLNLRQAGSTSSSILSVIPQGTTITPTGPAVNGWMPVSYGGKTGFVSADYLRQTPGTTTPPTTTPPTTTPGPTTPPAKTQANQSNPWYDPTSNYGASQNSYNTPLVKGAATFDQEYEKYLTEQGFGGNNQKGNFARNLADRAKSGLATAQMSNPNLTARDYLNTTLGSKFLANARAAATPSQRGESPMTANPRARWQSRF